MDKMKMTKFYVLILIEHKIDIRKKLQDNN